MGIVGEGNRIYLQRSLGAGAFMLLLVLVQASSIHVRSCGALPQSEDVVVAFELTRTAADLAAIFGNTATDCRRALVMHLGVLTWLDTLLLVPLYAVFLWSFLRAQRSSGTRLAAWASWLVVLAACSDWCENSCLFAIMSRLSSHGFAFALLPWATGLKWVALGACNAAGGWLCVGVTPRRLTAKLAAAAGTCCLAVNVAGIGWPSRFGSLLAVAVSASWALFLVNAALQLLPRRALA